MRHTSKQIAEQCILLLRERKQTLCVAESCTGGMLSATITSVSGASAVFVGGVISYANNVKQQLLGVDTTTLAQDGAVSERCALLMARGARKALLADWAVSTTGIAGPSGGNAEKPVGLVWVATSGVARQEEEQPRNQQHTQQQQSKKYLFTGDRQDIQTSAVHNALMLLKQLLEEK